MAKLGRNGRAATTRADYGERAVEDRAMADELHVMGQRRFRRPSPGTGKELPMQGKRMQGESAKLVAIDVLRAAREPLHTREVAKRAQRAST